MRAVLSRPVRRSVLVLSALAAVAAPLSAASPAAATGPAGPPVIMLVTGPENSTTRSATPVAVHLEWGANENYVPPNPAGGIDHFDIRYTVEGQAGEVYPPAWQGTHTPTVDETLAPETGRCWSARVTDDYGNASAWTTPTCLHVVDPQVLPALGAEVGTAEFVPWTKGTLTYSWATAAGVVEVDLATRDAAAGRAPGAWTTRLGSVTGLTHGFAVSGAGTQHCVRHEARDGYDRVSAWSAGRCTALPTDDRSLTRRGSVALGVSSKAIGHTYSRLSKKGASVTLAKPAGRKVGLWLLRGPGQGTANVYAGTRRIGTVSGAASSTRRVLVTLAPTGGFTGAVKVVQAGTKPVKVDGIAVLR